MDNGTSGGEEKKIPVPVGDQSLVIQQVA